MKLIGHSKPFITNSDIKSVQMALKRNYVGREGKELKKLESSFKKHLNKKHCVLINSGTNALKLCLLSLKLKRNSEIITSVYVCSAVVNVILDLGYIPRFIDVGKNDINIDIQALKAYIKCGKNKKRIGAIIIPYIGGYAVDISDIINLNIPVIEDCAASLGSRVFNKPVGKLGLFAVFSFGATKMITGGSGGMILTDSSQYNRRITDLMRYDDPDAVNIKSVAPLNYCLNNIQAALVLSQFNRLSLTLKIRKNIAKKYDELLLSKENVFLIKPKNNTPSYYRYLFLSKEKKLIITRLNSQNIDARASVAHLMYKYFNLPKGKFPNALNIENELVSLPIYPGLNFKEQKSILSALKRLL